MSLTHVTGMSANCLQIVMMIEVGADVLIVFNPAAAAWRAPLRHCARRGWRLRWPRQPAQATPRA